MTGSTGDSKGTVEIDAVLAASTTNDLASVIEAALGKGFQVGFAQFNQLFSGTATKKAVQNVQDAMNKVSKKASEAGTGTKVITTNLNEASREAFNLGQALQRIGQLEKAIAAAQYRARSADRQGSITARERFSRDAQLRTETLKGENSRAASAAQGAAQQQVVAARYAGKQRVLIVQEVLRTIGRLEKALGATITGIARTTTSAVSRIFSGLGSGLSKTTSLFRRSNSAFTNGVSSSLRRRESLMSESFSRQERTVRNSVIRQERQLTELRTRSSTGVLGAATGRGIGPGLGALVGGVGIAGLLASTFTIGADFTRGLAVLQAQLDLTGSAMEVVRAKSLELGNDISLPGVSALDAAQAIALLAKQFAALGDGAIVAAEDASKGTLQLARAAGVGAEDAAQIVGAAVNVFGVAATQATEVADQVTAALKNAAGVSFGDFADAFKQAGAVFSQFQTPAVGATQALLEFDTALAVLARTGLVGSDAGTSLKQFFLQANRGTDDAEAALANLTARAGEVGSAFYDAAGAARPFEKTLDILRRGLKGMTDEQRNSTLQTIFGSDAVRSANALLNISTEEYAKVTKSLGEQGLAAKIAAAQNTGFKGALDALRSVLETVQIVLFEKVNPALGQFTLFLADAANSVFFGGGVFAVIRQGFIGIAAGLGAVLAVKGVVEVFGLLRSGLALVLTPMGAVLAAAAVLGAGFNILYHSSLDFREAVGGLGRYLVTQGGRIWDAILEAVGKVREAFTGAQKAVTGTADRLEREAKPASRFFRDLANTIKGALFTATSFLVNTFIPTVAKVVIFLAQNVGPAIAVAIGFIESLIDRVVGIAKSIYTYVRPGLQPAIDGFHELANAIGGAFGGDFSGLGSGARSALSGIGTIIGNLASNIGDALAPVAKRIGDFFTELFSGPNIKKYISGVLDFVEAVGRTIALIVTSPTFVKAVAVIAAAAVVVGFRFIKGVGEGILQNLPGLFDLLGEGFIKGLSLIFDNLPVVLGVALAAALFGPRLLSLFRGSGAKAGSSFTGGLKASISGSRDVLSSLFGGNAAANRRGIGNVFSAAAKEAQGLQNQLRILGQPREVFLGPKQIQTARREVQLLRTGLTEAQIKGLALRDTFAQASLAGRGVFTGLVSAAKGIGPLLAAPIRGYVAALKATDVYNSGGTSGAKAFIFSFARSLGEGSRTITNGLRAALGSLRTFAESQGKSVGALLGEGLKAGAAAALAVTGGFVAGRAEGAAGGNGLLSAATAGLTAGLLTENPIIGLAAAGASLLGTAFGKAGAEAKKLRDHIKELAGAFTGSLQKALDDGVLTIDKVRAGLNFSDIIAASGKDTIAGLIADALGDAGLAALRPIGFTIEKNILPLLERAGNDTKLFATLFTRSFIAANGASSEFASKFGKDAAKVRDVLAEIVAPGNDATVADFLSSASLSDFTELIRKNQDFLQSVLDNADAVTKEAEALRKASIAASNRASALEKAKTATNSSADDARRVALGYGEVGGAALVAATYIGRMKDADEEFYKLPSNASQSHEEALGVISADIDKYTAKLELAKGAQDTLFNIPGDTNLQQAIDNALIAVDGMGGRIAEGLSGPATRNALRDIGSNIEAVLKQGVADGVVVDADTARFVTQGVFDAAVAGLPVTSQAYKDAATAYEMALSGVEPIVDAIRADQAVIDFKKAVQDYMDTHPVSVDVAARVIELQGDAIGRQVLNGVVIPGSATPTRPPIPIPVPTPTPSRSGLRSESLTPASSLPSSSTVTVNQTFNERVDTRAAAADIAWRLGAS